MSDTLSTLAGLFHGEHWWLMLAVAWSVCTGFLHREIGMAEMTVYLMTVSSGLLLVAPELQRRIDGAAPDSSLLPTVANVVAYWVSAAAVITLLWWRENHAGFRNPARKPPGGYGE